MIDLLAGEFDVIACDSPGFGRSAPLPAGIAPTIPAYVDAFEWFFAELGVQRPHVAGNSMGGAIALELARRRAISSATAFSPAGFWNTPELRFASPPWARWPPMPHARQARGRSALAAPEGPRRAVLAAVRLPRAPARRGGALDAQRRVGLARPRRRRSPALTSTASERPRQLRSTPVTVAWGNRRPPAPLPDAGAACARGCCRGPRT